MNEALPRFQTQPASQGSPAAELPTQLVEHFFRHESGRLVSSLARVFGLRNLDLVEDVVQSSLVEALHTWRVQGGPRIPRAGCIGSLATRSWMRCAARHAAAHRPGLGTLAAARDRAAIRRPFPRLGDRGQPAPDDLRLLPPGAGSREPDRPDAQVALRLQQRRDRARTARVRGDRQEANPAPRQQLIEQGVDLSVPAADELAGRLDSVHQCLYLLFNEGYAASSGDAVIRLDLCEEAARLCHLLCEQTHCHSPATFALLALMLFHAARFKARIDAEGRLLLLEDQDRSRWNHDLIARARWLLDESATGKTISTFHLEAGIAMLHSTAPNFHQTNWPEILRLYDSLIRIQPSPIYQLNRAIVLAHMEGPAAGIRAIQKLAGDASLRQYHLVDATLGELYRRAGDMVRAQASGARTRRHPVGRRARVARAPTGHLRQYC